MSNRYINKEIRARGGDILQSPEFREAMRQKHHLRASVGMHSIRVTQTCLRMADVLEKFGLQPDRQSLITAGLCHDLGMLGRGSKFASTAEQNRQHPLDSVDSARKLRPDMDDKTRESIERHMFPLTPRPPRSLEGVILNIADKYVSVKDLIMGR